eukprot:4158888-Alexandrium_andersonii.AAC.1
MGSGEAVYSLGKLAREAKLRFVLDAEDPHAISLVTGERVDMVLRQNTFHFPVKLCRDMQEAACGVSEQAVHRAWPVQAEVLPPDA